MTEKKFTEGARVVVVSPIHGHIESRVAKVYKTGRFVLEARPMQQWRPHMAARDVLEAMPTGGASWHRDKVILWDEDSDAMIRKAMAQQARAKRWSALQDGMRKVRDADLTDEALDAIEAALARIRRSEP